MIEIKRNGYVKALTLILGMFLVFLCGAAQASPELNITEIRKAADQGDAKAQLNLGLRYGTGKGLPKDNKKAAEWLGKAASQGVADAQYYLGAMYAGGKGVLQNDIKAYALLSLAAAQGHKDAIKNINILAKKLTQESLRQAKNVASELQSKIANQPKQQKGHPVAQQPKSSGTGFIVTANGYILTCQHVVAKATSVKVKIEDKRYDAQVVKVDPLNDLALLKIDGSFQPLAFSANSSVKLGQEVFTIGFPNPSLQGVSAKFTKGDINSLKGFRDDIRLYQISVPVQPGNSGGPLIDMDGNVDGVIVAMLDAQATFKVSGSLPQNVNYAVKSSYAKALLDATPEASNKLAVPSGKQPVDHVIERAGKSVVMVLAY